MIRPLFVSRCAGTVTSLGRIACSIGFMQVMEAVHYVGMQSGNCGSFSKLQPCCMRPGSAQARDRAVELLERTKDQPTMSPRARYIEMTTARFGREVQGAVSRHTLAELALNPLQLAASAALLRKLAISPSAIGSYAIFFLDFPMTS
jgi:hypothetical protein